MQALAGSPNVPQGARDRAGANAASGGNAAAGTEASLAGMGPNPHSFLDNFNADLTKVRSSWGTLEQQMASGLTGQIGAAVNAVDRGVEGWLNKTMTWKQALGSIWVEFAQSAEHAFIDMLVKYGISKAEMFAIDVAIAAKGLLLSAASAAKSLVMWLPSAIAASISSYGLAAVIGAAAVLAVVGHLAGAYEDGGYTGGSEGQPVGVVHGAEFVWSAPAVRAVGVGNLERAHQAALGGGGGASAGGGGRSGGSATTVYVFDAAQAAKALRSHFDARIVRMAGMMPSVRTAL